MRGRPRKIPLINGTASAGNKQQTEPLSQLFPAQLPIREDSFDQLRLAALARLKDSAPKTSPEYRYSPEAFLQEELKIVLSDGYSLDWVRDLATSWLHLHAREMFGRGAGLSEIRDFCTRERPDLPVWTPDLPPIINTYIFQGGSGLGKSVVVSGLLLWAVHVSPAFTGVVYAPIKDQAMRTTWRYVDAYLEGQWPGIDASTFRYILVARKGGSKDPAIDLGPTRSITTKATTQGTAAVQGQHAIDSPTPGEFATSIHIFEEADAISDRAIFDAVKTMTDKGVALWIICLNPATSVAPVQQLSGRNVRRYVLSVLDHPNVREGRIVIPGASDRGWVESKLDNWALSVPAHDPKQATFELPWIPGKIWKPLAPWFWRVLGLVPPSGAGDSAVSDELYLSAAVRSWREIFDRSDPTRATIGVDVARSDAGDGDSGSIALRWRGCLRVAHRIQEKDTRGYVTAILNLLQSLQSFGCREVAIRIDNGGGFGGGVRDQLVDHSIGEMFSTYHVICHDFGGRSSNLRRAGNWVTEAYLAIAQDLLAGYCLVDPPVELRQDLCGRRLRWESVTVDGGKADTVLLEPKKDFRQRNGRSPDDGDAVALACYPWQDLDARGADFGLTRWGQVLSEDRPVSAGFVLGYTPPPWELEESFGDGGGILSRWRR